MHRHHRSHNFKLRARRRRGEPTQLDGQILAKALEEGQPAKVVDKAATCGSYRTAKCELDGHAIVYLATQHRPHYYIVQSKYVLHHQFFYY